ncbi:MAG: TetR/AcrR family transcriptional regulator [Anaerolineales bacterium]|nr:TetR/AcrR family transcriptional regulator [Anaerolineales bacterium]
MDENAQQKELIADTFQRRFNHFGYKKTSVDEISSELKISKKTIYQHFNTKEEIFYYIVNRIAHQYLRGMERDLETFPTFTEKLARLIRLIFKEATKWLKSNDAFEFRYKYEIGELAFKDAYTGLINSLVQQGIKTGEFSSSSSELTVRLIQGMISEAMQVVSSNPDLEVENQLIESILKVLK